MNEIKDIMVKIYTVSKEVKDQLYFLTNSVINSIFDPKIYLKIKRKPMLTNYEFERKIITSN
jgi:hypothetical protein